jgi:DNA-binding MarR family transcriptional regulator
VAVKRKRKVVTAPFGLLLRDFFRAARAAMDEALKPTGFTPPQSMVLMAVGGEPGLTGAELARRAMITPQTMGELLTALEKSDLIRRQRHPGNARMQAIFLTEAGVKAQAACGAHMQMVSDRMLTAMSAADRKNFARLLGQATLGMKGEA